MFRPKVILANGFYKQDNRSIIQSHENGINTHGKSTQKRLPSSVIFFQE